MCALRRAAFITILQGLSETSPESRSTSAGNMGRRSGSARNAPNGMPFSPTGKLTPRPVALGSTNATAGLYFQGKLLCVCIYSV